MQDVEEKVAHLERVVDELSDVVARQQGEIAILTRRVQLLMEREAERESRETSVVSISERKPPHW